MSNILPTGLLHMGGPAFRADMASRLFPCRVRNAAPLDSYGESQLAGNGGGDFFDLIPSSNGLINVIGAISGQSAAGATLLLPVLRGFLRTCLPAGDRNIGCAVRELNRTLCDTSPDRFYATLFCAAIDPERRELHYVNAGHEPALLVRSGSRRVHRLESTGTVLGLTTRAAYGTRTIPLEPGDVLAAFTDGLVESADAAGLEFGEPGVLQVLRDHPDARSSELVACLVDAVGRFADPARPADDRTVTVVRFNKALADPLLKDEAVELAFAASAA